MAELSRGIETPALQRIVEKQVDKLEDWLIEKLFKKPKALITETVAACLTTKSDNVRLRATQLLFDRNAITLEAAKSLLTDSNHEVRLLAVESLKKLGHELASDLVEKALTIQKQSPRIGFGLFRPIETDARYYERYLSNRLAELDLP